LQQAPIILLKEGTDTSQGIPQIVSNINACQAIADAVRTTLGPRGMDKLIVDDRGTKSDTKFFRCIFYVVTCLIKMRERPTVSVEMTFRSLKNTDIRTRTSRSCNMYMYPYDLFSASFSILFRVVCLCCRPVSYVLLVLREMYMYFSFNRQGCDF
jgi:hypothetical protein